MEQKTLKDCTEIELKALAYDQIAVGENTTRNLNAINEELRLRNAKPVTEVPIPEVVEKKDKKK